MTEFQKIETELDYYACLKRIDELMDVQPDTDEGKELIRLSQMVFEYEEARYGD